MTYKTLTYHLEENVAEIVLDQPDKHNPLSHTAATELTDTLRTARADESARVVFLAGAGPSFSAGGDIEEFTDFHDRYPSRIFDDGEATAELFSLLARFDVPIVTAVNGHAFGGGCGLVAASHLAYASEDTLLGTTEITLGLFPFVILPALRSSIGDQQTLELALTADRISATEAAEIGLVTDVVAEDEVEEQARQTAREVADWSPLATTIGLRAFHKTTGMSASEAIDTLNSYRVLLYSSRDFNEGARAFLEDRDPEWEGY
jgi:methylglutaconyl-CoA hydratase